MSALKLYIDSQYAIPWAMSCYQNMHLQRPSVQLWVNKQRPELA